MRGLKNSLNRKRKIDESGRHDGLTRRHEGLKPDDFAFLSQVIRYQDSDLKKHFTCALKLPKRKTGSPQIPV